MSHTSGNDAPDTVPLVYSCEQQTMIGLLHPAKSAVKTGVLVVVGGPQYRVGSHRQFLLLARALAQAGIPCMRFDYRGMGDSGGEYLGFEHIAPDIRSAIDAFFNHQHGLRQMVLWGLCDAASAALFYAGNDPRVAGLMLLNPWVRTEQSEAQAYMKHYYWQRLFKRTFWLKLFSGRFKVAESLSSFYSLLAKTRRVKTQESSTEDRPLPDRMLAAWRGFNGPIGLILSGDDLTAAEFKDLCARSAEWGRLLSDRRVQRFDLPQANHTFASAAWRAQVEQWTIGWIKQRFSDGA